MDNHTPTENSHASVEACFKRDDMRGIWPFELNAEVARLTGRAMAELLAARSISCARRLRPKARSALPRLSSWT